MEPKEVLSIQGKSRSSLEVSICVRIHMLCIRIHINILLLVIINMTVTVTTVTDGTRLVNDVRPVIRFTRDLQRDKLGEKGRTVKRYGIP